MNEAVKQRLVGAVVLGCLAIIFIPMLLDGEGLTSPDLVIEVPVAPLIPAVPDKQPVRPAFALEEEARLSADQVVDPNLQESEGESTGVAGEAGENAENASPPRETVADTEQAFSQPGLDSQGLPEGWVVRMGAFGERPNAEALEARLQGMDYKAFIRPVSTSQGTLAGVYVGPVISRDEAERLRTELSTEVDIQGVVTRFSIDD